MKLKGKVRSKYEVCLLNRTSYQEFHGVVIFSVRLMVSPLSKAKDIIFTVFLVSAKRHFYKLPRFEIENLTSHTQKGESNFINAFGHWNFQPMIW